MKNKSSRFLPGIAVLLLTILFACTQAPHSPSERDAADKELAQIKAAANVTSPADRNVLSADSQPTTLPVRFQGPSYSLAETDNLVDTFGVDEDFVVKVGADISSSSGPVMLREILKKLAALKKMNISWASDVDQYSYVDVDIRANDDFFKALDDLLRQRDYFHEVQGSTIVVKYKETKKFHLAMPFTKSTYSSSVGATVSKTSQTSLNSSGNEFDIWANVTKNLDQVLNIWEEAASQPPPTNAPAATDQKGATAPAKITRLQSSKGFYTIDKPVGLITVTAPRRIIKKVEGYLNSLKEELYKQISIEAKILEVTISNSREVGIDWESLLNSNPFTFNMEFGQSSASQPLGPSSGRSFTMNATSFTTLVSAIEKQGETRVLANPRISVMNGQPALINVGKNVTYIDKVTTTVSEGVTTTDVTTNEGTSGVVMSIVATVLDNNEIVLNLTPVTSQLEEPIAYRNFGNSTVGLPVKNVRELSTIVKIKKGEMLVVGGLIDSVDDGQDENVPLLGRLPLIGKYLFSLENTTKRRKELVILLKPEII